MSSVIKNIETTLPVGPQRFAEKKAENALSAIFSRIAYQPKTASISSKPINTFFVISDGTFAWRIASDDITLVATQAIPHLSEAPAFLANTVVQTLNAPNAVVVYQLTGITTAGNMAIGMLGVASRIEALDLAEKLNDSKGKLLGRIGLVKDVMLTAGGAAYLGFRPLAAASAITHASATSLLGRVTLGFGMAGNAFFSLFFGVLGALSALNIHWGNKFEDRLNTAKDPMQFLQDQLSVDRARVKDKLLKKYGTEEAMNAALKEEALKTGSESLRQVMKELGQEMSKKEAQKTLLSLLEQMNDGSKFDLVELGLDIAVLQKQTKKEQKLARLTSGALVEKLKEAMQDPLLKQDKVDAIVQEVRDSLKTHKKINWAVVAMSVGAILATVGAVVFTGGIAALAIALIGLAYFVIMAGLDIYSYKQDMMGGLPGPHDRKALLIHAVTAVVTMAVIGALIATSVISFGLVPLIVAIVLTVGWVAFDGYSWMRLNALEKKYLEEHPTLEKFLEKLEATKDMPDTPEMNSEIWKLYLKLSKQHQDNIYEVLGGRVLPAHFKAKNRGPTMQRIRAIEAIRKAQIQQFRETIKSNS